MFKEKGYSGVAQKSVLKVFVVAVISALTSCSTSSVEKNAETKIGKFEAKANATCECIDYVRNNLKVAVSGFAKDIGGQLISLGYKETSIPRNGAIVVFQNTFGNQIDSKRGHTGKVEQAEITSTTYKWVTRGAKQYQSIEFSESSCNNVSRMPGNGLRKTTVIIGSDQASKVKFYYK